MWIRILYYNIVMKKIFLFIILCLLLAGGISYAQGGSKRAKLMIFYSPGCRACLEVKQELMQDIEKKAAGVVDIVYMDVSKEENFKLLLSLRESFKKNMEIAWPAFFLNGNFLVGKKAIKENFDQFFLEALASPQRAGHLQLIDLISHFKSFSPVAIVGAGLIDGINPCAFTVIVFFISFLALQGYKKKELIAIGISFILAVFLTYLLLGLGIFNLFYRLEGFLLVSQGINYAIGAFSVLLGVLAFMDFFKFSKSKETEGLFLQLPQSVKKRIHYVIGMHLRKPHGQTEEIAKPRILRLLLSTFITGFLVSLLEAVCTGQVYLPTITFVLKTSQFKLQALIYLLVYNIMFILPLVVIFLFALTGATSEQFSAFLKKHLGLVKILMGILFFALGIFLIWRG